MTPWFSALIPLATGIVLMTAGRRHLLSRRAGKQGLPRQLDSALAALDDAGLRGRFEVLAPEIRLTHAGAGRPRLADDAELDAFESMGLVEWVKEPHIAAGRLDVCRLTDKGKRLQDSLKQRVDN